MKKDFLETFWKKRDINVLVVISIIFGILILLGQIILSKLGTILICIVFLLFYLFYGLSILTNIISQLKNRNEISDVVKGFVLGNGVIIIIFFILYITTFTFQGFSSNCNLTSMQSILETMYFAATNNFYASAGALTPAHLFTKLIQIIQFFYSGVFNVIIIAYAIPERSKQK